MNNNDKFKEAKGGPLIWFIKDRIAPFNAVILACGTVSGAIDFVVQGAPSILLTLASLMAMAALFVLCTLRFPSAGMPGGLNVVHSFIRRFSRGELVASFVYLLLAAGIFSGAAYASNKNKGDGGAVAALFPMLSDIQKKMGRIEEGNTEMKERIKLVKLETSKDPRKELANRGVMWTPQNFHDAIHNQDLETVMLFLQGKLRYDYTAIAYAENAKSEEMIHVLAQHFDLFMASDCNKFLTYVDASKVLNPSDPINGLIKAVCSNPEGRKAVKENTDYYEKVTRGTPEEYRRMEAWAKEPAKCVDDLLHDRGPKLNTRASNDMETYKRSNLRDQAVELARERCNGVVTDFETSKVDPPELQKWKTLAKMLS